MKTYQTMKCLNCGKKTPKSREWKKFCSGDCRFEYWDKINPRIKLVKIPE